MAGLTMRPIGPRDAEALERLFTAFGHPPEPGAMPARLARYLDRGETGLIAVVTGAPVGVLTLHVTPVLHRAAPVGRITALVVAEGSRGLGVGEALVRAAEVRLKSQGCGSIEVTSNVARDRAHNFYERLGYERTSVKLVKTLG